MTGGMDHDSAPLLGAKPQGNKEKKEHRNKCTEQKMNKWGEGRQRKERTKDERDEGGQRKGRKEEGGQRERDPIQQDVILQNSDLTSFDRQQKCPSTCYGSQNSPQDTSKSVRVKSLRD